MNRDLTVGEPRKVLWSFCLPLFGSIIFQQLYNIADSLVAGKFIGENALAAVGNSYEITLIFIAFAVGCNIGCSVIVSRYFGARDYVSMRSAVSTSMISAAAVCFLLMLVGIIGCGRLLRMIDTPAELFRDSKLYLDIYVWGLPFVFFYNISTGIFSALGDSRTPFLFLAASSLSNIALDVVFVTVFKMGVAGVAWATFICQGVSCALAMTVIARRLKEFRSAGKYPVFSKPIFWQFAVIAVPSTMQQSFVSVGNIIVQRVINGFGAGVMAGYAAGVKLNNLVITSFVTVGNGISNYTSQNIGAGKYSRIDEGFRAGVRMMWTLGVPFILLYFFGGKFLLNLFMDDPTKTAMETGIIYLRILAPFYVVISSKHVADGILRGGGLMKEFMVSTFASLFIRVLGAVFLSRTSLGSTGIWLAWPIGWIAAAACAIYFYKHHKWETPEGESYNEETDI